MLTIAAGVVAFETLARSAPLIVRERKAAFRKREETLERTIVLGEPAAPRELVEGVTLSARLRVMFPTGEIRLIEPRMGVGWRTARILLGWGAEWWRPQPGEPTLRQAAQGRAATKG